MPVCKTLKGMNSRAHLISAGSSETGTLQELIT